MEYERLSDRQLDALKYNIVLQGSIFSSNGFLVCCGITILFIYKVLLYVMFKGFKAVGVCGVACKDNSKVDRCRDNGVINRVVNRAVDSFVNVDGFVDRVWIRCGNE